MSFSKPKMQRPFSKTIEWKGSFGGQFVYYDKDKKENVPIDLVDFVVLEEMKSISGYNDETKEGVWSNEVMNLGKDEMTVRLGKKVFTIGLYNDIKANVKSIGGKFTQVLYAIDLSTNEIVRVLLAGCGVGGWIDKGFDPMVMQCGVRLAGRKHGKKGSVEFDSPVFERLGLTKEQCDLAYEQCEVIEGWLKSVDSDYVPSDPEALDQDQEYDQNQDDPNVDANVLFAEAGKDDEIPF